MNKGKQAKKLENERGHSHLGFEVLRGVTRGFINKLFKVRHVPVNRSIWIALWYDVLDFLVLSAQHIWSRVKTWKGKNLHLLALKVWNCEKHLHDRVEVAAVAQIFHASQARAEQRLQGGSGLLDHLPLPHTLIDGDFKLCHCPLGLAAKKHFSCEGEKSYILSRALAIKWFGHRGLKLTIQRGIKNTSSMFS